MKTKIKAYEAALATLALLSVLGLAALVVFVNSGCAPAPEYIPYYQSGFEPYGDEPNSH